MQHVVAFSGGKDATATSLLLEERGVEFTAAFADTGWEHELTYGYVWGAADTFLRDRLTILRSAKYDGFADLVVRRHMFPGKYSRFCSQELKVFPLWAHIAAIDDDVTLYQGIRAEESQARSRMTEREWVAEGNEDGHYRPGYWIERPIFRWTAAEVFDIHKRHGVEPNPLYKLGAGRVGCAPCIFVTHRELRALLRLDRGMLDRMRDLEHAVQDSRGDASSFFRSNNIPQRFCSMPVTTKDGRTMRAPTVDDVANYVLQVDEDQLPLMPTPKCLSIYNLCE